jgi:hypothetical protein
MGLHAFAISTGSVAQGGSTGLDPRWISASGMSPIDGPPLQWYSYRILAKARPAEQQHIGLLVTDPGTIIGPLGIAEAYWDEIVPNDNIIVSQKGFYLPRWRGSQVESQPQNGTAATSSWQWIQGLDDAIKIYNEGASGNEYYPGNYGWILGVAGSPTGGWNVQAWFWGSPGSNGGADPQGAQSFLNVVNSLPTGAYQPGQANARDQIDAQTAFNAICYSVVDKANSLDGGSIGNFVVVYNTGSILADVGIGDSIGLMTTSIW